MANYPEMALLRKVATLAFAVLIVSVLLLIKHNQDTFFLKNSNFIKEFSYTNMDKPHLRNWDSSYLGDSYGASSSLQNETSYRLDLYGSLQESARIKVREPRSYITRQCMHLIFHLPQCHSLNSIEHGYVTHHSGTCAYYTHTPCIVHSIHHNSVYIFSMWCAFQLFCIQP